MGAFVGLIIGLAFGGFVLWFYRGLLVVKARSRQPQRIEGEDYYIVPAAEYGNLITARDLARAAVRDLERRRHVSAADPYKERREPGYQTRADGGHDKSPRGGQLEPGS
jgi:hypothetical protein